MIDVSQMTDEQLVEVATDGARARDEISRREAQRSIADARELAGKIKIGGVYFTHTITADVLKVRTLEVTPGARIRCELIEVAKGKRVRALIWNRPFEVHPSNLHTTIEDAETRR